MSFPVAFLLELVHQVFGQHPARFDHISDEGEDKELNTNNEHNTGNKKVIQIRSDFESAGKILYEKKGESDECQYDENECRYAEKFHRPDIAHGFENDARAVIDEAVDAFDDLRLAIGKIGDLHRHPEDAQIFADGINNRFLRVRKARRVVQTQKCFSAVSAKTAGQVICFYIEKRADE